MKPYGQFCPVAQALEVIGERWTLLVVRELLSGSRRFGEILRGLPRMPRSMLSRRLFDLREAGLLERIEGSDGSVEYELTDAGWALEEVVFGLGLWARQHVAQGLAERDLDARLLMWDMQRRIDPETAPEGLVVLRFDLSGAQKGYGRFWLKIRDGEGDLCLRHPGHEETLLIRTDVRTMTEVWMGHRAFAGAIRRGAIQVRGPRKLARQVPRWFKLNTFVELEQAAG